MPNYSRLIFTFLVLAAGPAVAQPSQQLQADSLWSAGDRQGAATLYEQLLTERSLLSLRNGRRMAQVYELQGRYSQALWVLLKAQQLAPKQDLSVSIAQVRRQLSSRGDLPVASHPGRQWAGWLLPLLFAVVFVVWLAVAAWRKPLLVPLLAVMVAYAVLLLWPPPQFAVVMDEQAVVMDQPSGAADAVDAAPAGSIVQVQASEHGWQQITLDGRSGYVRPELLRAL